MHIVNKSISRFSFKNSIFTYLVRGSFTEQKKKTVTINVKIDDQLMTYQFPIYTKLAKNLSNIGAPLEFECGFGCSCGTCSVRLQENDAIKMKQLQSPSPAQIQVLTECGYEQNIRLSCQLFILPQMENLTVYIQ